MGVESLHLQCSTNTITRIGQTYSRADLLQGTLNLLILQTLQWGEQHGYGISQAIRIGSNDVLQVDTGSLYPALHKLEKRGWIQAEWKISENNQRAKYYRLTAVGRKQLAQEQSRWRRVVEGVEALIKPRRSAT